ncbi:MAG TPA: tRNA (guanosine(37)-N1)-methyltransferase TrmD [Dehalococcoidia bacterium]|nr:tRNA (guanosine(37)-N1)-methyltransferase TrmD [Dehalococcoidia bacterium]
MRIDVLTLFPEIFAAPLQASILGRALREGVAEVHVHDIRTYAKDKHQVVDDYAYGGGPGMVMKPEPLAAAIEGVRAMAGPGRTVLLTPQGRLLNQSVVDELAREPRLILVSGHYEGVDERIREHFADDEISIGDYVLSGGEFAALVIIDAVVRRLPGTLGSAESLLEESHSDGLLEYPQYTRPAEFRGWRVPDILLSGNHGEIARWRRRQRILRTAKRRPDLIEKAIKEGLLSEEEQRLAAEVVAGGGEVTE